VAMKELQAQTTLTIIPFYANATALSNDSGGLVSRRTWNCYQLHPGIHARNPGPVEISHLDFDPMDRTSLAQLLTHCERRVSSNF
jgi:hypothetical protein